MYVNQAWRKNSKQKTTCIRTIMQASTALTNIPLECVMAAAAVVVVFPETSDWSVLITSLEHCMSFSPTIQVQPVLLWGNSNDPVVLLRGVITNKTNAVLLEYFRSCS